MTSFTIPILMYHAISEIQSPVSISPNVFEWQLRWLKENRVQVVSLRELIEKREHAKSMPPRSICLTFDDGFACLYENAIPLIHQFQFPATIFLVTGYCGLDNDWPNQPAGIPRLPLLSWSQIRELDRRGIEIGAHTVTHPRLDQVPPAVARQEIVSSKAMIEDHLGHPVDFFSYPYGRFTSTAKEIVKGEFIAACSTKLGWYHPGSDRYALERVDAHYIKDPYLFRNLFTPFFRIYLSLRRAVRSITTPLFKREWT